MKRLSILILIAVVALIGCGNTKEEISISISEIQQMVDKKFPYNKNAIVASVELRSPKVYFTDKNIGIKLEYSGGIMNKTIKGNIDFNGRIIYKPQTGAFHLNNLQIVELTVDDSNYKGKQKLKEIVGGFLSGYLNDYPVYTLNPNNFKQNIAKLLMKDVNIKGDNLVVTLSI